MLMRKLAQFATTWNPSRKTAALIVVACSIITVVSLAVTYAVTFGGSNGRPGIQENPLLSDGDSTDVPATSVLARVSHISPYSVRLYAERSIGETASGSYSCLNAKQELTAIGPLDAPYTVLTELSPGSTVKCVISPGKYEDQIKVPEFTVPYPLVQLPLEGALTTASIKTGDEPLMRLSWPTEGLKGYEAAWLDYALYDGDRLVSAGREDAADGSVAHLLPTNYEDWSDKLELAVWLTGKFSEDRQIVELTQFIRDEESDWEPQPILMTNADAADLYVSPEYDGVWLTEKTEAAATLDAGNQKVFNFIRNDTEFIILSKTNSLAGPWQTLLLTDESKEIEKSAAGNYGFYTNAAVDPKRGLIHGDFIELDYYATAWRIINPSVIFNQEGSANLSWKMLAPQSSLADWNPSGADNFIITVTDILSGAESTMVYGGDTSAVVDSIRPNRPYWVVIDYVDMKPNSRKVQQAKFLLRPGIQPRIINHVPFSGSLNEGRLALSWNTANADYPLQYWVQVVDSEKKVLLLEKIKPSDTESLSVSYDLGTRPGESLEVRVLAVDYAGRASDSTFTRLADGDKVGELAPIVNLRVSQTGGREFEAAWSRDDDVISGRAYFELQQYLDGRWVSAESPLLDNSFAFSTSEDADTLDIRVRVRTATQVGPFSRLSCTYKNGLFCE